jgi:hypothetical protein
VAEVTVTLEAVLDTDAYGATIKVKLFPLETPVTQEGLDRDLTQSAVTHRYEGVVTIEDGNYRADLYLDDGTTFLTSGYVLFVDGDIARVGNLDPRVVQGPPIGSVLFTDSGSYYCSRADVELVFGIANVSKWADLDNEENATFIANRITTMIALAHEQLEDAIRHSSYDLPFDPIPVAVTYHTACLAGVLLYESRGEMDAEDEAGNHRLTPFRRRWQSFVKQLLSQAHILDATRSPNTNTPFVS